MMKKILVLLLVVLFTISAVACGGNSLKDADLKAVYTQISEQVSLPATMMELNSTDMLLGIYGINAEDIKQYAVCISGEATKVDEIVMIEAVDSAAAQRVASSLNNRKSSQYSANVNYLPDQAAIIQKSEVKTEGNYVVMFISPDADAMTKIFNTAIGK